MDLNDPARRRKPDFIGMIVLVAVLGMIVLGLTLFPMVKRMVTYQDCVGSGRTDCARVAP